MSLKKLISEEQVTTTDNMVTIGIVGITIPGALDCMQKIRQQSKQYFEDDENPNMMLDQSNFKPTHAAQDAGRWDLVANHLIASIKKLELAGANFVIIPANTVHKVIDVVQQNVSIPIINLLEIVSEDCAKKNFKKVGVIGTSITMSDHLYRKSLQTRGIEEIIHKVIFTELIPTGKASVESLNAILGVVRRLKEQGCDSIILACTELPLILNDTNCEIATIDSTDVLAKCALEYVVNFNNQLNNDPQACRI